MEGTDIKCYGTSLWLEREIGWQDSMNLYAKMSKELTLER